MGILIALSIVGLVVVVYRSSLAETLEHLRGFDRRWLAVAAALFVLDFLMAGTRIYLFARKVNPDISYRASVRSCFVNVFVGGVTPSQTGGGPAQIWVMHREGLSLIDSTVVCFVGGFLVSPIVTRVAPPYGSCHTARAAGFIRRGTHGNRPRAA